MRVTQWRTVWAFVVAGTIGLTSPVAAQTPTRGPADPGSQGAPPGPPAVLPRGHTRLAEIQVELAWLADPVTFPFHLQARATEAGLEARGYVPTEAARDRALELARQKSRMTVIDALRIHPTLVQSRAGEPAAVVQQAAAAVLAEAYPDHATKFAIQVQPRGQVRVLGEVPSREEQLAISKRLRRVRGCTSVDNQLSCLSETRSATAQHFITRTRAEQVLRPDPLPEAQLARPKVVHSRLSPYAGHLATPYPVFQATGLGPSVATSSPAETKPAAQTVAVLDRKTVTQQPGAKVASAGPIPLLAPLPTVPSGFSAPEKKSGTHTTSSWLTRLLSRPAPDEASQASPAKSSPAPAGPNPAGPPSGTTGAAARSHWFSTAAPSPPPAAPSAPGDPPSTGKAPKPAVSSGPKVPAASVAASKPLSPIVVATKQATAEPSRASGPYVASGIAVLMGTEAPKPLSGRPNPSSWARLERQVAMLCGNKAHDVEVTGGSASSIQIRLKVRKAEDAGDLGSKILAMPELGPYQVALEVQVIP